MQVKLLLTLLVLAALNACKAQISMPFSMDPIGGTRQLSAVYSGPMVITGKACFQLSNGIGILSKRKTELFTTSCFENKSFIDANVSKTELRVYPNPFVSQVTIRSLKPEEGEKIVILIYNSASQAVKIIQSVAKELYTGIRLDLQSLPAGMYFGSIMGLKQTAAFNMIKVQ